MSKSSHFKVQVYEQMIVADLNGNWTEQDDLSYVSLLSEKILEVRANSWGLLVDLRGWEAQEAVTKCTFQVILDRRNQKVEYWIVDDILQGEFLMMYFENTLVKPVKFLTPQEAIKNLKSAGFDLPNAYVS